MKQRILTGLGIAAMMASLSGCDEVKFGGSLGVNEQITFAQNKAADMAQVVEWESNKATGDIVLNPGQFSTKITMGKSGKKKLLTLEVANANPATVITMKFDKNINLGENFTLTAAQLGQNFDLTGNLITKVERSPERTGYESCTYQYPQTVCRSGVKSAGEELALKTAETAVGSRDEAKVPSVPNPELTKNYGQYPQYPGYYPGYPGSAGCSTIWVSRPGTMYVRYYYETTTRDISARFVQGEKNLADYQGKASNTEKINTYQGSCN